MRVIHIGPYPTPRGGVSVHIERITHYLEKSGFSWRAYDMVNVNAGEKACVMRFSSKLKGLMHYLFHDKSDIVHFHMRIWKETALWCFITKFRHGKFVITFHSFRETAENMNWFEWKCLMYVLKHADGIISTGYLERDKILSFIPERENIWVIPAFVAPPKDHSKSTLPDEVEQFFSRYPKVICANGSNMDFYNDIDTYGLDHFVELCAEFKEDKQVGFIYCLSRITDPDYMRKLKNRIEELGIGDKMFIHVTGMEFWQVIERSALLVRPTVTDSYGISVAEAICLGVPAIASDVCVRPEGTILFEKRNLSQLIEMTKDVLDNEEAYRKKLEGIIFPNYAEEVVQVYRQLIGP